MPSQLIYWRPLNTKALSHSGHWKCLIFSWIRWLWLYKFSFVLKDFPQVGHTNSLLFSWDRKWLRNPGFLLKLFWQIVHLKSLRSLWTNEWCFKVALVLNFNPQTKQLKGLTSLWVEIWYFSSSLVSKVLLQMLHSNEFSKGILRGIFGRYFLWVRMWASSLDLDLRNLSQKSQRKTASWLGASAGSVDTLHSNDLWASSLLVVGSENLKVKKKT